MPHNSSDASNPRFTVIIPCKNRAEYLRHTLRTCMIQDYEPFEVIVSDDCSTDNTREVVEEAMRRDSRIIFLPHPVELGMRDNFEDALSQVKPGYVLALGGDDGLMPHGIAGMAKVLGETGLKLLTWSAPVYKYPFEKGANGALLISYRKGQKIIGSKDFLNRQSKVLDYLGDPECPMIYVKGVASTELVDNVRVRSKNNRFYTCQTPDGYSGIVLSGEVERYAFSSKPFSIYGLSVASQGQAYKSNSEEAKLASEQFYRSVSDIPMHGELASQPYSPLITLMTADYLLRAKDLPGWSGYFPKIDYKNMLTKGINELAHGLYGEDRIARELAIMDRIAVHHGLEEFYRRMVKKTRRNQSRTPFEGNGLSTKAFYLDPASFSIEDIFDAAYVSQGLCDLYAKMGISSISAVIKRSIRYGLQMKAKGGYFPSEEEWITDR